MISKSTGRIDSTQTILQNLGNWLTPVTWYQVMGTMSIMAGLVVALYFTLFFRESVTILTLWILCGLVVSAIGIFVLIQDSICQFYNIARDQLFCGGLYFIGLILFLFTSMWFALNPHYPVDTSIFQVAGFIALMTLVLMESSEIYLAFKTIRYLMVEF